MVRRARAVLTLWLLAACTSSVAPPGEQQLLERRTPYNTVYVSQDTAGLRVLRFEPSGARQSVVKLSDPDHLELRYTRVVPLALAFVPQPKRALIIGLGGGSIPMFLRAHFPQLRIDTVDIDPVVVEVAKSHFGFREDERVRAFVDDGRHFVEHATERYDLVVLDGFGNDGAPPHLTTREFLSAVKQRLQPGGVVVSNVWGPEVNRAYASMVKTYAAVYPSVKLVEVPDARNLVLLASTQPLDVEPEELVRRAATLTESLHLRYGLEGVARRSLRDSKVEAGSGWVLTDEGPLP